MRTTLKLDPDVAERIEQEARQTGMTRDEVANETLRTGLGLVPKVRSVEPFQVKPHSFGFRSDLNLDKMNQLVDELEALEALRKLKP